MADGSVVIDVELNQDKVKQGIKKTKGNLEGLKKASASVTKVGKTLTKSLTVPIVGTATAISGLAVKMSNKFEEAGISAQKAGMDVEYFTKSQHVLKNMGVSTDNSAKAMERFTQRVGRANMGNKKFQDILTTLGVDFKAVEKGTLSLEDAFGQSLNSLTKIKDKSEMSAVASELFGTRLSRNLMPAIDDMIKSGKSYEEILETVQDGNFTTNEDVEQAEKFNESLDKLKDSVERLMYSVGGDLIDTFNNDLMPIIESKVIPKIEEFGQKIRDLIEWFSNLDGGTQGLILKTAGLLAVIGPIVVVLGTLINAIRNIMLPFQLVVGIFKSFNIVTMIMSAKILLIVASVGALILIGVLIYKNWDKIVKFFGKVWDWLLEQVEMGIEGYKAFKEFLVDFFEGIWDRIKEFGETLRDFFKGIEDWINKTIQVGWDKLVELFSKIGEWISEAFQKVVEIGKKIVDAYIKYFKFLYIEIPKYIFKMVMKIIEYIKDFIISFVEKIVDFTMIVVEKFTEFRDKVVNKFIELFNKVKEKLTEFVLKVVGKFKEIYNKVVDRVIQLKNKSVELINNMKNKIIEYVKNLVTNSINKFIEMKDKLVGKVKAMYEGVVNKFKDIQQGIKNVWNKVMDFFTGIDLLGTGKDIIKSLIEGITGGFDNLLTKVSDLVGKVKDKFLDLVGFSKKKSDEVSKNTSKAGSGSGKSKTSTDRSINNEPVRRKINLNKGFNSKMNSLGLVGRETTVKTPENDTNVNNSSINIEKLEVRDEKDIREIAKELDRLRRRRNRFS